MQRLRPAGHTTVTTVLWMAVGILVIGGLYWWWQSAGEPSLTTVLQGVANLVAR